MEYRKCGLSGIKLPAISLGLWHNFGEASSYETADALIKQAFDDGITYFDLANNYGPPPGSAEEKFGAVLNAGFKAHRDEIIIATKAGHDMWHGVYGAGGSRKHVLASLDQSLVRMGLEYVDIFYSHVPDPETPLEETLGAVATAITSGKALYAGISKYTPDQTRTCAAYFKKHNIPFIVHQPRYNMIDRDIEQSGLLDTLEELGLGCVIFSPLAQGVLTNRYLKGIAKDSRATHSAFLKENMITDSMMENIRQLQELSEAYGYTIAQLALKWALRDTRVTSAIIGASRPDQITDCVASLDGAPLDQEILTAIDRLSWP